ncbi:hypothetical protein VCR15J2_660016 [Vibrio coralliirubri]|nr:hypothetical protein VCR15J2_660016 [Vibrio coralliirubri]
MSPITIIATDSAAWIAKRNLKLKSNLSSKAPTPTRSIMQVAYSSVFGKMSGLFSKK